MQQSPSAASIRPEPDTDRRSNGFGKRVAETLLVASPVAFIALGLSSGAVALTWGTGLALLGLVALAVLTWTQKWPAYLLMLVLATVLLFDRGLLAAAAWAYAGVLILVAITNLVVFPLVNRRLTAGR